jgi:hypothetical protein
VTTFAKIISHLRNLADIKAKQTGTKHTAALNAVAREHGLRSWKHALTLYGPQAEARKPTKSAWNFTNPYPLNMPKSAPGEHEAWLAERLGSFVANMPKDERLLRERIKLSPGSVRPGDVLIPGASHPFDFPQQEYCVVHAFDDVVYALDMYWNRHELSAEEVSRLLPLNDQTRTLPFVAKHYGDRPAVEPDALTEDAKDRFSDLVEKRDNDRNQDQNA